MEDKMQIKELRLGINCPHADFILRVGSEVCWHCIYNWGTNRAGIVLCSCNKQIKNLKEIKYE